jgi:hypothetical protein
MAGFRLPIHGLAIDDWAVVLRHHRPFAFSPVPDAEQMLNVFLES